MPASAATAMTRRRGTPLIIAALLLTLVLVVVVLISDTPQAVASTTVPLVARQETSGTMEVLPTGVRDVAGQPEPTTSSTPHDPLLAIMPDFAFSMPAQIVTNGVNLALVSVLTIHLLFTAQYHFPLSRRNYTLQIVSTFMLLISLSVQLHIVLKKLNVQSHTWPYMFAYIGVQIPPQDGTWTTVQEAFFLLMRACTTALIHLTHIQFLTLLFPSALEARLILWMLGPLALAASGMEFTNLSSSDDVKTSDLGDAIRNICNSTLTLLYTSALLIWGTLVNRRRAWRTDGGTAAFGGGSVGLALINTAISFVEIAYDRVWWLPDMCWTLTIWQSWLGFWWWVGSGMGIGEVEDRVERQERQRKRAERLHRKREREERQKRKAETAAAATTNSPSVEGTPSAAAAASSGGSEAGVLGRFRERLTGGGGGGGEPVRRRATARGEPESYELDRVAVNGAHEEDTEQDDDDEDRDSPPLTSVNVVGTPDLDATMAEDTRTTAGSSSDTHPTAYSGPPTFLDSIVDYLAVNQPNFIRRRMKRLRTAHAAAARRAATEQTALRDQVLNGGRGVQGPGLRTMMLERSARESASHDLARRTSANGGVARNSSLLAAAAAGGGGGGTGGEGQAWQSPFATHPSDAEEGTTLGRSRNGETSSSFPRTTTMASATTDSSAPRVRMETTPRPQPARADSSDAEWEDADLNAVAADARRASTNDAEREVVSAPQQNERTGTWRNGLRNVRRRDRSTYD